MRSKIAPVVIVFMFIGFGSFLISDVELEGAPLADRERIYIEGNSDFTPSNGVTGGSGTEEDPYIIEGWSINASKQGGIVIRNASVPFIIRDIYSYDGELTTPIPSPAVKVINSTMFRIESSLFERNHRGIYIGSADNFTISNNTCFDNYDGIKLDYSVDFHIEDNSIMDCTYGLSHSWVYDSRGSIWGNDIRSAYCGISLGYVSSTEVSYNLISNSTRWGIKSTYSETNLIHHNNFFGNEKEAYTYSNKPDLDIWDLGYPLGGNYWSNYTGNDLYSGESQTETGSDGIGDVPYQISIEDYDRYPLMEPVNLLPFVSLTVTPLTGNTEQVFQADTIGTWDLENGTEGLEFRWDFEGDGTYDTIWSEIWSTDHTYNSTGNFNFTVQVRDGWGDVNTSKVGIYVFDDTDPITTNMLSGTLGVGGWYVSNVTVTLNGSDDLSPIRTFYKVDNGSEIEYSGPFNISTDGLHIVNFYSVDTFDNIEAAQNVSIGIDRISPRTEAILNGTMGSNGWFTSGVNVTLSKFNDVSGVNRTMYNMDNMTLHNYTGSFDVAEEGEHIIYYMSVDEAGIEEDLKTTSFKLDTTVPFTSFVINGTNGDNGWYRSVVEMAMRPSDDISGVNRTMVSIDRFDFFAYEEPLMIEDNGIHGIRFYSIDDAGNEESMNELVLKIDRTIPSILISQQDGMVTTETVVTISWSGTDGDSDLSHFTYQLDGGEVVTTNETLAVFSDLSEGSHTLLVTSFDLAGNPAQQTITFTVDLGGGDPADDDDDGNDTDENNWKTGAIAAGAIALLLLLIVILLAVVLLARGKRDTYEE